MATKDPKLESLLEKTREQLRANNKDPQAVTYEVAELIQGIVIADQTDELEDLQKATNSALGILHNDMQDLISAIAGLATSLGSKIDTSNSRLQATNDKLDQIYSRLGTMATNQNTQISLLDTISRK